MYFNICLQEQNHERSELSNLQPVLKPRKKGFLPICFHTFFFSIDKTTPIEVSIFLLCNTFVKTLILGLISNYLANSFHAVIKVSHKKEQHYVCVYVCQYVTIKILLSIPLDLSFLYMHNKILSKYLQSLFNI